MGLAGLCLLAVGVVKPKRGEIPLLVLCGLVSGLSVEHVSKCGFGSACAYVERGVAKTHLDVAVWRVAR